MKLKLLLIFFLFFGIIVFVVPFKIFAITCSPGESVVTDTDENTGASFTRCAPSNQVTPQGTYKPPLTLPNTDGSQPSQQKTQTTNVGVEIPNPLAANDITDLVNTIATWLLGIGSTIAVIMVLFAAFLFMTSGGNKEKVTQARQTLWYAIIGLTVLLLAKGVALFIQNVLSGRF